LRGQIPALLKIPAASRRRIDNFILYMIAAGGARRIRAFPRTRRTMAYWPEMTVAAPPSIPEQSMTTEGCATAAIAN
jgi:hypothetical protein